MLTTMVFAGDDQRILSIDFSVQHKDGTPQTKISDATLIYGEKVVENDAIEHYRAAEKTPITVVFEDGMRRAEALYVVEETSHRIVWANAYLIDALGTDCIGKTCWETFLGRTAPCPFCPQLSVADDVYAWDYYDPCGKHWMKVKHLLVQRDGILYRTGNVNMVDDMMRLGYEAVREIVMLQDTRKRHKDEVDTLERLAIYDMLTGLYNRNCFHIDLAQEYTDTPGLGVLYLDINNLKETNDRYRHEAGDVLLCRVADAMRCVVGYMEKAKCYRVGGDEFVLMLAGCTEAELIHCEELFAAYLEDHNKAGDYPCQVAVGGYFLQRFATPKRWFPGRINRCTKSSGA